jgi:hypothetical protein
MSDHFIWLSQILNVVIEAMLPAESVGHQIGDGREVGSELKSEANSREEAPLAPSPPPPPPPPPMMALDEGPLLPQAIRAANVSSGKIPRRNFRNG